MCAASIAMTASFAGSSDFDAASSAGSVSFTPSTATPLNQ